MAMERLPTPETETQRVFDSTSKTVYLDRVLVDGRYLVTLFEWREWAGASAIEITSCLSVLDKATDSYQRVTRRIPATFGASRFDVHLGKMVDRVEVHDERNLTVATSWGTEVKEVRVTLPEPKARDLSPAHQRWCAEGEGEKKNETRSFCAETPLRSGVLPRGWPLQEARRSRQEKVHPKGAQLLDAKVRGLPAGRQDSIQLVPHGAGLADWA